GARREVQLPGEPLCVRRGRPGNADLRRPRLQPPHAFRAHLPPSPPLPHHRGFRGDPDAQGRPAAVRLRRGAKLMSKLRLVELWRHPVKSLQGERLDSAVVEQNGVAGDRSWGIRDEMTGRILTGRREPSLLLAKWMPPMTPA